MRIIAGSLSGRLFRSPRNGNTHPMSEMMRGGLFNVLGDISGLKLLDTFAGSGAIGLEAASRGAAAAVCIESDRTAQRVIAENIAGLNLQNRVRLIKATVSGWLSTSASDQLYDIIVCDPPYHNLQLPVINQLAPRVGRGGLLVLSWPSRGGQPTLTGFETAALKTYGDGNLLFYKRS